MRLLIAVLLFCCALYPACPQFLEQLGIGRFDVEPLREGGAWRFANAFQDPRVLIVGRVYVAQQAHYEERVDGKLGLENHRRGLRGHAREALRGLGESRFPRFMSVNVHPEGRVLLKLAGGGEPILLERAIGRGKVLLYTS
ncbi:hypothetical protein LCGC14_3156210, partial [marine sediment metagenome]